MTVVINGTSGYIADFSNATVASRQAFQTSTTNGTTGIYALPNGTSTAASWQATNAADPTNASKILIATNGSTDVQLVSGRNGSGTYLPLSFYTNGSQQMVLDTSGRLGIGETSPTAGLQINRTSGQWITLCDATSTGNGDKTVEFRAAKPGTSYLNLSYVAYSHIWGSGSSPSSQMTLDASGNLLLASASANSYANYTSFQIGSGSAGSIFELKNSAGTGGGHLRLDTTGTTLNSLTLETRTSIPLILGTGSTGRVRIDTSGNFLLASNTQYYGLNEYTNKKFMQFNYPPAGQFSAASDCTDISTPGNGSSLVQLRIAQVGNVACRGTFYGGQTLNDYAEYFEWDDGNPNNEDRIGVTVVLDNGKIRQSTESDTAQSIIGVVSGTAGVVLGSSPFEWSGKYEKDEFGRIKTFQETWIVWTDESGSHNYKEGEVPEGVIVPQDAERKVYTKEVVSSSYDESIEYVNREHRNEWACIGLTGQVHIKRGQLVGDRWIKMKTVSENVDLWFIR